MNAAGLRAQARACRAEWTKLRTEPGNGLLLLGLILVTVGVGAATSANVPCPAAGCGEDQVRLGLSGVTVGQALVVILAVLRVGNEYAGGLIRTTFAAVPVRGRVLAAKAAVLGGSVLVTGGVAILASLLAGRLLLPGSGYTAVHGYAALSLADGPTLRAAAGSVLYLVLVALLALGVATAVRDAAVAAGLVLGLLYLFPLLSHVVTDPWLQRLLARTGPMPAGLAIQATTHLERLPIGPWPGLGVLALWSAAAVLLGATALRLRDV